MRISDWSSDVCSSDLLLLPGHELGARKRTVAIAVDRREARRDGSLPPGIDHHVEFVQRDDPIVVGLGFAEHAGHQLVEILVLHRLGRARCAAATTRAALRATRTTRAADRKSTRLNSSH